MKTKDQKVKKEKSWWSNLSLELITKSSLNFLRDLHGLPRVRWVPFAKKSHSRKLKHYNVMRVIRIDLYFRYVERSSVQKKLPIELWLTHPRLRVEKFPPGSLEVVNFIRNKNEDSFTSGQRNTDVQVSSVKLCKKNETFTLEEFYEAIYPNLPSTEVSLAGNNQDTSLAS